MRTCCCSPSNQHTVPARTQELTRAWTERAWSDFKLELSGRRPLRRNSRFLPAVCPHWRRLSLVPRQYTLRSRSLAEAHGLRAGEPFFRLLGNFEKQRVELRPGGLQNMFLRQPAQDLASGNSHALTRRGHQTLVEVADQYFFHHVPGIVGAE